jgi:three-Cys-motif partner protein
MVLIEEDRRRIEILKGEMGKALAAHSPIPETLRPPRYSCSDNAESLIPILESIGAFNRPIFAFLDSFGGSDIPLDIARTIAAAPASEVFVTFGTNYLMRFGERNSSRQEGDKVFGSTEWHDVFQLPAHQKKTYLVSTYRQSLKRAGFKYVTSFEMLDEGGHPLQLVHGTTHLRGLEKMKNAMWTVDPVRGVRFRDPRDPNQGLLEFSLQPDIGPLRRALLAKLADNVQSVAQLQHYALCETVYRSQHVWPLLRELLRTGLIELTTSGRFSKQSSVRLATSNPVQAELF